MAFEDLTALATVEERVVHERGDRTQRADEEHRRVIRRSEDVAPGHGRNATAKVAEQEEGRDTHRTLLLADDLHADRLADAHAGAKAQRHEDAEEDEHPAGEAYEQQVKTPRKEPDGTGEVL